MQDLVSALDAAIAFARAGYAAMPEDMSLDDEDAAIAAFSASANELAELLAGSADPAARAKAEAWIDGTLS
jgi:hypothetical protein